MTALQVFHFIQDRSKLATEVIRTGARFNLGSDERAISTWLRTSHQSATRQHDGARFAGLFLDPGLQRWTTPELLRCVAGFEEGARSALIDRYGKSKPKRRPLRLKRLVKIERELEEQGIDLWYDEGDAVPQGAEDQFKFYTFVYLDSDDDEIVCNGVWLHSEIDAAITQFLIDEPYGRWQPIALMEGTAEPLILAAELGRSELGSAEFGASDFATTDFQGNMDTPDYSSGAATPPRLGATVGRAENPRKNVSQVLAEILTRHGIAAMNMEQNPEFKSLFKDRQSSLDVFRDLMRDRRPLVIIETQYWEITDAVGRYVSDLLGMEFTRAGVYHDDRRPITPRDKIVFYDDVVFNSDYQLDRTAIRGLIKELVSSNNIGLVVVGNKNSIPLTFQNYTDFEFSLPPIVGKVREEIFEAILGKDVAQDTALDKWSRYLLPFDFEKVLATGLTGKSAVTELKARVDRRLSRKAAINAPALDEIHGLGEAKEVALQLVGDIRLAVAGELEWTEVDRGMLLVGSPGTGKTMLAKAISKESGIRFISGSALEWQASGALDKHLAAIREFFAEARRYAPTIIFIDEFDAIGNRQHHQGRNDYYTTAVVNCVLEELQGFQEREGVIVIGATNEPDKIDPALKRAGRLDQMVTISRPNVHELAKIFDYHIGLLAKKNQVKKPIDTEELAKLSFGQTGADVEFYVRGARRRARKDRRRTEQRDFVAEIMRRPLGPSGLQRMKKEEIHRTAVHESGHALMQLTGPSKGKTISYVSIVSRSDGSLGFVASYDDRVDIQRDEVMEQVRIIMGGRAAEEVIYGRRNVGAGAGGGTNSDLGQATRFLTRMFLQHGYSRAGGLFWVDASRLEAHAKEPPKEIKREVRRTLNRSYREAVQRLRQNRRLLKKITKTLLEEQEMTGPELRAMVATHRLGPLWFLKEPLERLRGPRGN